MKYEIILLAISVRGNEQHCWHEINMMTSRLLLVYKMFSFYSKILNLFFYWMAAINTKAKI
jgi:hypothetical protein